MHHVITVYQLVIHYPVGCGLEPALKIAPSTAYTTACL
jgi:hypothetical protein